MGLRLNLYTDGAVAIAVPFTARPRSNVACSSGAIMIHHAGFYSHFRLTTIRCWRGKKIGCSISAFRKRARQQYVGLLPAHAGATLFAGPSCGDGLLKQYANVLARPCPCHRAVRHHRMLKASVLGVQFGAAPAPLLAAITLLDVLVDAFMVLFHSATDG